MENKKVKQTMHSPLISIITPYYNDQDFLADAIESVLKQTYTNFEYILVNHACTDRSRQIAHSFQDPRIKHIDLPFNYGASGNILVRKGLDIAKGEYVKTLCADDILRPNALQLLLDKAIQTKADLVFGDVCFINKKREPITGKTWFESRMDISLPQCEYIRLLLQGKSFFPYAGNFIKKTAIENLPLDYICVNLADMQIWLTILLKGGKLSFLSTPVADYRVHDGQMCSMTHLEEINIRNPFEHLLYVEHILNTPISLEMFQSIFPQSVWAQQITEKEQNLIPFVFAYELHRHTKIAAFKLATRLFIAQTLNQPLLQQQIEKTFSYTIKDIRTDILQQPVLIVNNKNKSLKEANLKELSYYFFRKIAHILLLKEYKEKRKTEQRIKDKFI